MPDLSMYEPDPVVVCAPGHHITLSEWDTNAEIPTCITCGLDLESEDQEEAWHLDQILNDPNLPSDEEI